MRADESSGRRAALHCRDVSVDYDGVAALHNLTLDVDHGEVVALLGASGAGKSTLLNVVAGFLRPSNGEVWIGGQRVAGAGHAMPPEQRSVGMVFQNFALWPHLSVLDTVAYPVRRAGRSARESATIATELLGKLDIAHLAKRRPAELSGGEQQRVGLARALARNATLYLLDEPTAHLDTHVRAAFQESLLTRQNETGAAVVYATHDATEALALADRVALMVAGQLIQTATPALVYSQPVSVAAAALTGPCSLLDATVAVLPAGELSVDLGEGPITVVGGGAVGPEPRRRTVLVRPDWVHVGGPFASNVTSVAFRGAYTDYRLQSDAGAVVMSLPGSPRYRAGESVPWRLSQVWALDGRSSDQPSAVPAQPDSLPAHPSAVIAAG